MAAATRAGFGTAASDRLSGACQLTPGAVDGATSGEPPSRYCPSPVGQDHVATFIEEAFNFSVLEREGRPDGT